MTTRKQKSEAKSKSQSTTDTGVPAASAQKLKAKGASTTNRNLSAAAMRLADSAKANADPLKIVDWPPARTEAYLAKVQAFDAADTEAKKEKEASKDATAAYDAAFAVGLGTRDVIAANIRVAALGNPEILERNPLKLSSARSREGLAQWFIDVPALIEKVSAELKQRSSTDWVAVADEARQKLAESLAAHQQQMTRKQELAQKRLVARNALVDEIDALVAHAGVAFVGNPVLLAQFRKGYGKRKAKAAASTTPAEGAGSGGATAGTTLGGAGTPSQSAGPAATADASKTAHTS